MGLPPNSLSTISLGRSVRYLTVARFVPATSNGLRFPQIHHGLWLTRTLLSFLPFLRFAFLSDKGPSVKAIFSRCLDSGSEKVVSLLNVRLQNWNITHGSRPRILRLLLALRALPAAVKLFPFLHRWKRDHVCTHPNVPGRDVTLDHSRELVP